MPKLISPWDQKTYDISDRDFKPLQEMGYTVPADPAIRRQQIEQAYGGWKNTVKAGLYGVAEGVPGLISLGSDLLQGTDLPNQFAQEAANLQEAHPIPTVVGKVAGGVGSLAIGGALLKGAGVAAEAVGGGAGVIADTVGAGAEGAAELGAVGAPAAGPSVFTQAAQQGALNAALGQAYRLDNAALNHALNPEGEEKLSFAMGDLLTDAAIGAAFPIGTSALGKVFKGASSALDVAAQNQFRKRLVDNEALTQVVKQSRGSDIWQAAEDVGAIGKSAPEARSLVEGRLTQVSERLNAIHGDFADARVPVTAQGRMADVLGDMLEGHPLADHVVEAVGTSGPIGLRDLQALRQKIYGAINWNRLEEDSNSQLRDAGLQVNGYIKQLLKDADPLPGSPMAQEWTALDTQYSNLSLLRDSLRKVGPKAAEKDTGGWFSGPIAWAVMGHGNIAGALGVKKILKTAATVTEEYNNGAYAEMSGRLSKLFDTQAARLSDAVEGGLYGATVIEGAKSADDFHGIAARLSAVQADPKKVFQNVRNTLAQEGVPDEMADKLANRQLALLSAVQKQVAARTGPPDLPTRAQPDLLQQHKVVGLYNTAHDPAYGIANPSAANLTILKQFYPQMLLNTQNAVLQQLRANPDLPPESLMWASQLIGRPINSLASPLFSNSLAVARQPDPNSQQSGTKSPGGPNSQSVQSENSETRLESLSDRS